MPGDVIERIVEAATWAPSAGNRQTWVFTAVTSAALKRRMADCVRDAWAVALNRADSEAVAQGAAAYLRNFEWFGQAPVLVVVTAKSPEAFLTHMLGDLAVDVAGAKTSAAMAAQNLMLAAFALGLGSCCLTGPLAAQEELKAMLGLKERQTIVCLIALGYPAEKPPAPPRKPLDAVMRFAE